MCWSEGKTSTLMPAQTLRFLRVTCLLFSSHLTFDPPPPPLLQVNVTLKQLDLSYNGFGNVGAQALGEALHHNNTLVLLDVSSNRISDEGTRVLFQGLAANDSLRVLRVGGWVWTDMGGWVIWRGWRGEGTRP